MSEQDFLKELGFLGFTMRLKRVADKLMHDGRRLYQSLDYDIEPNWYGIFLLLDKYESLSITEISERLNLSHPSVITIINKMVKADYLQTEQSTTDQRKRFVTLTAKAKEELPKYKRLWNSGTESVNQLLKNTNLLAELSVLEENLQQSGFEERTLAGLEEVADISSSVEIFPFEERFAVDFKKLNYEWLQMYFRIEPHDIEMLESPKNYIVDPGGEIFFAVMDGIVVGTVALLKEGDDDTFELGKMAVSPMYKGKKIGKKLMEYALEYSRKAGKKRVFLESNTVLTPAIKLYEKMGFQTVPQDPNTPYERANIRMEIVF